VGKEYYLYKGGAWNISMAVQMVCQLRLMSKETVLFMPLVRSTEVG